MKVKVYRNEVPPHIQLFVDVEAGQVAGDIYDDDGQLISSAVFDADGIPPQYEVEDADAKPAPKKKAPAKKPAAKKAPAKKAPAKKG